MHFITSKMSGPPVPPKNPNLNSMGHSATPKMYPDTKFEIPFSKNIGDVPEVKVKVTPK